jgi:transposase
LMEAEGIQIYPINPKQLARYREAVYPAGGKSDPRDAELGAMFLRHHREQLRPWQPDTVETRKLAQLSELRRKIVEERKSLGLRLEGTLKLYFPSALKLFQKPTTSEFMVALLQRWPSLEELQRAHPKSLRQFFKSQGIRDEERQSKSIEAIRSATPLTRDAALIETYAPFVRFLARQIAEANRAVAEFEEELRRCVAQHPDEPLFRAIPGAGDALVPRLIAAFGTDRDRYESAEDLQCYSGIAPITKRSGKSCSVLQRFACPKFLKQTFHEFADQARKWSTWSRAFYDLKRSQGMKHNAAVRALAFKWIRILFHLWKTRSIYSEAAYIAQLQKKHSPLIPFLQKV